jgi:cytoskeletal protein RodZ
VTELGTRLKEARQQKGYSLEDLQEITKIQKRYLVGIEEGNYDSMPGSFYVRAFIKQYAEAVGLNANEILEQYQHEVPNTQATDVAKSFSTSQDRRKLAKTTNTNKMMETMPKVIVVLFIIAILVIMAVLISKKMNEKSPVADEQDVQLEYDKKPTTVDPEEKEEEEAEEEQVEEIVTPKQTISEAVVLSDGTSFEYTVTGAETFNIRVEAATGPSWIGIRDINGKEQLTNNDYKLGDVLEYDASALDYVRIRLGRALDVKVFVNDEELVLNQDAITQNVIIKKGLEESAE